MSTKPAKAAPDLLAVLERRMEQEENTLARTNGNGGIALIMEQRPDRSPESIAFNQMVATAGVAYATFASGMTKYLGNRKLAGEIVGTGAMHVEQFVNRLNPQDPMEEALAQQAAVVHIRCLWLNKLAAEQTEKDKITTLATLADRASNTFRRLMLGLRTYRQSPVAVNVEDGGQANVAHQMVVQHNPSPNGKQKSHGNPTGKAPALPSQPQGTAGIEADDLPQSPVGQEHGSANGRRKGAGKQKRNKARRTKRAGGIPAGGASADAT